VVMMYSIYGATAVRFHWNVLLSTVTVN
jgi:hypothetical protein